MDEKCVDGVGCCLKNELSDDDPVYWSLQITLAEGKGKDERGCGGLPLLYHAINITLHESYEFRAFAKGVDDPFVLERRVDFVAI